MPTTKKSKTKKVTKKKLVVVESPSKAKTISKFLGSGYKVIASVGHVRDLPKSRMAIDIENDFEPQYINIRGKGDVIKSIKKEAKNASQVYLATDPDREGEAISWHLAYLLGLDINEKCRVVFNEITKETVKNAIKSPRKIDLGLVDAQQARRVLDRLVGYSISPLLWKKVKPFLSAGRVQSATLKMICDREKEIEKFVPQEYWNVYATFNEENEFIAKLVRYEGNEISLADQKETDNIINIVKSGSFVVNKIEKKSKKVAPYPAYTTSTLQQDSSNKLNFSTRKTMQIAQQLYEGINVKNHGTIGLVSYIRTDSVRISDEAKQLAKDYIINKWGERYYLGIVFKNKNKEAQDAHEAIRPSYVNLHPDEIKDSLTSEQYKLYKLIWQRFVASQMSHSIYDTISIEIKNGDCLFKTTGTTLHFEGHLKAYPRDKEKKVLLPILEEGVELKEKAIEGKQSFTKPPARFSESSLVKTLEELNIGRPSTYASIVATLLDRRYIKKEKKVLIPTELGITVTDLLSEYFSEIIDTNFTASIEEKFDDVAIKNCDWKQILRDFYPNFANELEKANEEIEKIEQSVELTDIKCELCGKYMVKKQGRYGDFLACSGFPECKNTKPIVIEIGVKCPNCGGELLEKKSRRGKIFYGCSNYPECDNSYWNKPTTEKCPKCGSVLLEKITKKNKMLICSNDTCDYKEVVEV